MEYRPLGRSGISVSHLCLGAMMFGAFGNADHDDAVRIIRHALDAGINVIDTADGYSDGESEQIIGEALVGRPREEVVLAVKFGRSPDGDPNHGNGSRRFLTRAVEGSLARLRTDYIDLYQFGVPDADTDLEETISALTDLVRAGKIRSFGTSKQPPSRVAEAQAISGGGGFGRVRSEQSPYSMLTRAIEYDLLPTCARHGIGVLAFGALGAGWLSGRYRKGEEVSGPGSAMRSRAAAQRFDATAPANAAKLEAADALGALADEAGLTLPQLAIAFTVRHPAVTSTIIGPRTYEQLEGCLTADGVRLTDDVLDRIDEIVGPGDTVAVDDNMWAVGTTALAPGSRRR